MSGSGRTESAFAAVCRRRYALIAAGVLVLAAVNLTFRLNREVVTEWDEALYATSASEIVTSGHWIDVTFLGARDYYNTKPPLNVWLIALSFKTFGVNLVALRLPSVLSAWIAIAVLMAWTKRVATPAVSLFAGLILSTCFGYLYVHAARSANTDALFTLIVLLTVVTLWSASERPWRRVWLGPLLAAAFLLRGMAVLMPFAIITATEMLRGRSDRRRWLPLAGGLALGAVPVAAWMVARWRLDQWQFLARLFGYDFVSRTVEAIEGHNGGWLYYLNVLQKDAYEWLLAGAAALVLCPWPWARVRAQLRTLRWPGGSPAIAIWAIATLLIPTLMRTKLAWYLTPFFPVFALGTAGLVAGALSRPMTTASLRRRRNVLAAVVVVVVGVAEGKLAWYSYHRRDVAQSVQGAVLSERRVLGGHAVFRARWDHAEAFVLRRMVGAQPRVTADAAEFLQESEAGDFFVTSNDVTSPALDLVGVDGQQRLYRHSVVPSEASAPVAPVPLTASRPNGDPATAVVPPQPAVSAAEPAPASVRMKSERGRRTVPASANGRTVKEPRR